MSKKNELVIKSYIPIHNQIKLTAHRYEAKTKLSQQTGTKILSMEEIKNEVKPYQQVLAVGATVRELQPGDWVILNPDSFRSQVKNDSNMPETADALGASRKYNPLEIQTSLETENGEVLLVWDRDVLMKVIPETEENL